MPLRFEPVLAIVCALVCATGCSRARPRIVVWIEIDSLRADALGCYGNHASGANGARPSPAIDALAADGLRFEHAYSTEAATLPSLRSQLSGAWPWEEQNAESERTFVSAMRAAGWRTAGVRSHAEPATLRVLANGFERWDESAPRAREGSARLFAFADELAAEPGAGLFLFAGFGEPSYPYTEEPGLHFGPSYAGALKGDEDPAQLLARRATLDDADKLFLRGRYQSEVAALDRALGELVAALRTRGWYDDAWIVLDAAHGEELFDRGWIGHGHQLHEELVHVPWIVKPPASLAPKRRGAVVQDVVSLIDLSATLLDGLQLLPAERTNAQGHSRSLLPTLLAGTRSARTWIYLHAELDPARQWGVIDAETALKWTVDHAGERPLGRLYELKHDPFEINDLARLGAGREAPLLRLRALQTLPLQGARPAPRVLPEEPWIPRPADLDGAGPAMLDELR